jgi:peptide/nickel transport system ATP-binding protein
VPPSGGTVTFDGHEVTALNAADLRALRPAMQIIFQDPISSLNPRRRVRDLVAEPLEIWDRFDAAGGDATVAGILDAVGLDIDVVGGRRPRSFSGGQAQRVCIARALVAEPKLVVCDEPVSALDVSVQAQILNLLKDLKERHGLTLLFISHDLSVIHNISDRIAVMYLGKLCEIGDASAVYATPAHPYTAALMASILEPDPSTPIRPPPLAGEVSSAVRPPSGCRFRTRCLYASERCAVEEPVMRPVGDGRFVACHHPLVPVAAHGPDHTASQAGGTLM